MTSTAESLAPSAEASAAREAESHSSGAAAGKASGLSSSLFGYAWRFSAAQQATMLALTLCTFPIAYLSLELPKLIIDDAIRGDNFPRVIGGFELEQDQYLLALALVFLGLHVFSNAIKYIINLMRSTTGERLLRRLRFFLSEHRLRAGESEDNRFGQGELVQIIAAELRPIGVFLGDVFTGPVLHGGSLIVYLVFIFVQDPFLGAFAIIIFPIQAVLIPMLQQRVVRLTGERIINTRELAEEVSETVAALPTLRAYGLTRWRLARLTGRLHSNFEIRRRILVRKFLIKFVSNVLNHVTPFAFYAIGGWFVISGELQVGALVAVIAAYRDLAQPWRELLRYYQEHSDFSARYRNVIERFELHMPEPMRPPGAAAAHDQFGGEAGPDLLSRGFELPRPSGPGRAAERDALRPGPGARVRISGADDPARSAAIAALAGLSRDASGADARLAGASARSLSHAERTRLLPVVDRRPVFFAAPLRHNLALGLLRPAAAETGARQREVLEARATGNFATAPDRDWLDPSLLGEPDTAALDNRLLSIAERLGADRAIFELGLSARPTPETAPTLTSRLEEMRGALAGSGDETSEDLSSLIEFWDIAALNPHAPLVENLLFAAAQSERATPRSLAEDKIIRRTLRGTRAETVLLDIGAEIADATAELVAAVGPDAALLKAFDLYPPGEAELLRQAAAQYRERGRTPLDARKRLIGVAFGFTPARHRLDVLSPEREAVILSARGLFKAIDRTGGFSRFDAATGASTLSVRDLLLNGRLKLDRREQWGRVTEVLIQLCRRFDTEGEVLRLGLDVELPRMGGALTQDQKLRLALTRAIILRPAALMLDSVAGEARREDAALRDALAEVLEGGVLIYSSASPSQQMRPFAPASELELPIGDPPPAPAPKPGKTPPAAEEPAQDAPEPSPSGAGLADKVRRAAADMAGAGWSRAEALIRRWRLSSRAETPPSDDAPADPPNERER